MTFCRVCGKLLKNVRFDPSEIVLCQKCADTMKGELVRVVRCKDCRHYENCEVNDLLLNHEDGYCSDGEKRTD